MAHRLIISIVFVVSSIGCAHSQDLTIAFTRISSLETGAKVYATGREIGYVTDFKPNRSIDTIFVSLKIIHDIKVPKGSKFYLDENSLGPSHITVEFSKTPIVLTSNDISIGIFRPLKIMTPFQIDSAKLKK